MYVQALIERAAYWRIPSGPGHAGWFLVPAALVFDRATFRYGGRWQHTRIDTSRSSVERQSAATCPLLRHN